MTHPEIVNPFIRKLLALELYGYHETKVRAARAGHPMDSMAYIGRVIGAVNMAYRFNLQLDRNREALLSGNQQALDGYRFFGGH